MELFFLLLFLYFLTFLVVSKGHFFSMLLGFEGIMLFVFYIFCYQEVGLSYSMDSILIILSLMVMEGSMGLAILIYSVNWFGRDMVFSLSG